MIRITQLKKASLTSQTTIPQTTVICIDHREGQFVLEHELVRCQSDAVINHTSCGRIHRFTPLFFFSRFTTAVISPVCPSIFNWQSCSSTTPSTPVSPHLLSDPSPFSPVETSPSLASLLATPLANLGPPSRTASLVLSSAILPIPGKVSGWEATWT